MVSYEMRKAFVLTAFSLGFGYIGFKVQDYFIIRHRVCHDCERPDFK